LWFVISLALALRFILVASRRDDESVPPSVSPGA